MQEILAQENERVQVLQLDYVCQGNFSSANGIFNGNPNDIRETSLEPLFHIYQSRIMRLFRNHVYTFYAMDYIFLCQAQISVGQRP